MSVVNPKIWSTRVFPAPIFRYSMFTLSELDKIMFIGVFIAEKYEFLGFEARRPRRVPLGYLRVPWCPKIELFGY